MKTSTANLARRVMDRCQVLARFSEDAGSLRRTFLSPPMRDVHQQFTKWLEPLGMTVRIDNAGNLRTVYPAAGPDAPRLLLGSHLDTVPNAGMYDGILGVVIGVALLEALDGVRLPYSVEVIGFSEEEGVRFSTPFIGSKALIGELDQALMKVHDPSGISVRQAISDFGLDPANLENALLAPNVEAYIEFHIEQGPALDNLGLPLAAVEAIAGQSRLEFAFFGHANHAGTTPMHLRRDPVAAAAEWITVVEQTAIGTHGLVATVGSVQTIPGAVNVIAGEARLTLDVRHSKDEIRNEAVKSLIRKAQEIADRRGLKLTHAERMNQAAVAMDPLLTNQVEKAVAQAGCTPHRMISGAGHDAMILARRVPVSMIFLRTPRSISHDPAESVLVEDVEKAIQCGLHLLNQLASDSQFLTRTCRA